MLNGILIQKDYNPIITFSRVAELLSCYSDVEISSDSPIDYALKDEDSSDRYLLGKSYFDLKEYQRCANVLRDETNMQSVFLKNYALYLV